MRSFTVEIRDIHVYRVPIKAKNHKEAEKKAAKKFWDELARTGDKDTYFFNNFSEETAIEVME